jgi:hypothetical protein
MLKTNFKSLSSSHVSVNDDDFPLISNARVWPNSCLIAPFLGQLNPEQIHSTEDFPFSS